MTVELTKEQIAQYYCEGFISLGPITTPEDLARVREIYDELFASRGQFGREMSFDLAGESEDKPTLPQILSPSDLWPELKETLLYANAKRIVGQLLAEPDPPIGDHAILKPAGYGAPTPWHQDEAYWNPAVTYNSMSIWVPLQDVGVEQGCLHFVKKSNRWEVLPHRPIGDNPKTHGLELAVPVDPEWEIVACPLVAGGCTIHQNRTLHYAPANASQIDRRALILMGGAECRPYPGSRRFEWQERQAAANAPAS